MCKETASRDPKSGQLQEVLKFVSGQLQEILKCVSEQPQDVLKFLSG